MNKKGIYFDRELQQFVGLTDDMINKYRIRFPHKDIDHELMNLKEYIISKTELKGTQSFITNWLSDRFASLRTNNKIVKSQPQVTIRQLYQNYDQELWKKNKKLMDANTSLPH